MGNSMWYENAHKVNGMQKFYLPVGDFDGIVTYGELNSTPGILGSGY